VRRHSELCEQAAEQGVVSLVVDEEAGVEREPVVHDGVGVPAGPRVALEDPHVVLLREQVRRAEPGDATADDRDSHQPFFARRRTSVDESRRRASR
jgi:hypothetical protein